MIARVSTADFGGLGILVATEFTQILATDCTECTDRVCTRERRRERGAAAFTWGRPLLRGCRRLGCGGEDRDQRLVAVDARRADDDGLAGRDQERAVHELAAVGRAAPPARRAA